MKLQKVIRPEIEIEYKGAFGFMYGILCAVKFGMRRMTVDFTIGKETVCKRRFFVIPKYKIMRWREENAKT